MSRLRLHEVKNRIGAGVARFRRDQKAAAETVNQLVVVGATLFIGIVVISQIGEAMPDDINMFTDAFNSAESIVGSSLELAAILPLVIVAGGLLFYVSRFGRSSQRR